MNIDPARLCSLRERRAWSQEQLAEVAGVSANPLQAALASAAAFSAGALLPLLVSLCVQPPLLLPVLIGSTLLGLATLGYSAAKLGGAKVWRAVLRVVSWGALALATTASIGHLFGIAA